MNRNRILSYAAASAVFAMVGQVYAASATWTGGHTATDPTVFNDGLNWSTGTVPGPYSDVATFSAANNGTTIKLPAALGVANASNQVTTAGPGIGFSATAVAYTIGTAANDSTLYITGSGYNITAASGAASQILNQALFLGNRGSAGINLTNSSAGTTDTYNGNITSYSNGANTFWTVTSGGAGAKTFNGVISDTGIAGDGLVLTAAGGLTTVNNAGNTYTGGTRIQGGALAIGTKSSLGTGTVTFTASGGTVSAGADLSGANAITNNFVNSSANATQAFAGANNLQINGTFDLNSTATTGSTTILNVTNSQTTTLAGVISNSGASTILSKTGAGVLVLSNAANTYAGNTYVNGGTLLLNGNTGTSGFVQVSGAGTVLGGSGTTAGIVQISTGTSLQPGPAVGNSTGVLTTTSGATSALVLQSGSTTVFDINGTTRGTSYDAFTATGNGKATFGGAFTINLNTLTNGQTVYDLFAFNSQVNPSIYFSSITLTGPDAGALTNTSGIWSGTFNGGKDTVSFSQVTGDLTVNAVVPEPASLGLLTLGATALIRRRRQA